MVLFVRELSHLQICAPPSRRDHGDADTAFRAVVEAWRRPALRRQRHVDLPPKWSSLLGAIASRPRHSIETWIDGELAGGLYGVAIGRMSTANRCSRAARTRQNRPRASGPSARALGFEMIDWPNEHKPSRVARFSEIRRPRVLERMRSLTTLVTFRSLEARRRPDRDLPEHAG